MEKHTAFVHQFTDITHDPITNLKYNIEAPFLSEVFGVPPGRFDELVAEMGDKLFGDKRETLTCSEPDLIRATISLAKNQGELIVCTYLASLYIARMRAKSN